MKSSIEQLLSVPEKLQFNLSSHQIISILDYLLYESLKPIVQHSRILVSEWLGEILSLYIHDTRRKLSVFPLPKFLTIFGEIQSSLDNPDFVLASIKTLRLERNIIFHFVGSLLKENQRYQQLIVEYCVSKKNRPVIDAQLAKYEARYQADRVYWSPALKTAESWINLAQEFKNQICQKYYRMAWREASRAAKITTMNVSVEDLFSNYCFGIEAALDKFNPDKGVLTSYIMFWLKNANINPKHEHQFGLSYTMPNSRRRDLQKKGWTEGGVQEQNIAVNIDDNQEVLELESFEKADVDSDLLNKIKKLKNIPEIKYTMLYSGIHFPLSKTEKAKLANQN